MSRQRLHRAGQFSTQHGERGGVGGALRANHQIDGREMAKHVASQDLTQPTTQAIARHGSRLMERNDETESRVTQSGVTPGQIEVLCAPTAASRCFPAGRQLRAARDADAARVPLARLPAPVFGWNTDGETLATLLAPAREGGAAPNSFHPRAKSVLIDAPPIARPICRAHEISSSKAGKVIRLATRRSRLTFPHTARTFGPPLQDVLPFFEKS
jgi:hypothetical protein